MMQVGIKDATSKSPSWIQLQSLDLAQHIKWLYIADQDDFEQTVQETYRTQLDDRCWDHPNQQPSWKITIIRQGNAPVMEMLLAWNHPQFDGAGAKVFHEDLIQMLNTENSSNGREGLDGDILKLPKASPLLPVPIEKLKNLSVSPPHLGKTLWEEMRPQVLNWDKSLATWCPIRTSPYKTQYRAFFIDNKSLIAILALCRKNKTTITGLLNGLALIAFSSHLDSKAAPAFQSSTIVDHRRNLPSAPKGAPWVSSDRVVANYVTQAFHRYGTRLVSRVRSKLQAGTKGGALSADLQRELWIASARNRREIVDKLHAGLQNDLVGVFKYVKDWEKTMRDQARKTRQFSWLVTNIGVLDGDNAKKLPDGGDNKTDDAQRWSIERAQFGLSAEVPAAAIEFAAVSVAGHGMCVSSNWADCAVDTNLGDRIMADLERWLNQLGSQS
ncbi:hypothetical protein KJ359_011725 [Pestalotiopsis sp. 9143b]|nr:hypothetical protein KJ359_011725 [Pestalotiopsis sp. 9143b]